MYRLPCLLLECLFYRLLRFQLQLRKFHYPTVSTDPVPNTVVLTVSDIGPQAHYAPVADIR